MLPTPVGSPVCDPVAVFEFGPGMWARHPVPWSSPRVGLVFVKTPVRYKETVNGL